MFGMLDYRAHKLYWLLARPVWLFNWLLFPVSVAGSFSVGNYFFNNFLAVFAVGVVASVTVVGIPIFLLSKAVEWLFNKIFKFFIDVVPTDGRNEEEAWQVVTSGESAILLLKLSQHILEWSDEDTEKFVRNLPWTNRMFFAPRIRARFSAILEEAKRQSASGEKVTGLNEYTVNKINKERGLELRWYEHLFGNQYFLMLGLQYVALFVLCVYAAK